MDFKKWLGEDNALGLDILNKKYRYNNESFDQFLDRVSGGYKPIRDLIQEKKFLFGGRILASRGVPGKKTLSNCYVITPPEDNIESIFEAAQKLARTYSYGGGCGVDIGKLAPRGAGVNNAAKHSSGAVSFMDLYNTTTGLIGQGGRRGALMISIPVNHPDVEEFVQLKSDLTKVTNANISVRITDDFMRAVENDEPFTLTFTREATGEKIEKTIRARDLFHKMCEMNWNYAEPGMLFWDRIEKHNMLQLDNNFQYAGTNPCAEEPLPAGGSCLLGALNLAEFVKYPFTDRAHFAFLDFCEAVRTATYALNEVLEEGLPLHPLAEQRESVAKWRQIGLGIFGLADCLIKLGLRYGSEEANELCENMSKCMFANSLCASEELAIRDGDYDGFDADAINCSTMLTKLGVSVKHLRNSQLLTVAPTGSISTMLGVSGGIEPIFANYYTRKTQSLHGEDVFYKVYTPIVKEYMDAHGIELEEDLPDFFVTAADINPAGRIACQAAWQEWIDASISSTINLPNEATVEEVEAIYMMAWKMGLKGVTVYRAGCAREGILVEGDQKKADAQSNEETVTELKRGEVIPASENLIGLKRTLMTGCGSLHLVAFFDECTGELRETYLAKGSTGGCNNFMTGLSRMISLSARAGVDIETIVDQLNSCGACPSYAARSATKHDTSPGSCCPVAVGNALMKMYREAQGKVSGEKLQEIAPKSHDASDKKTKGVCPVCGAALTHEGGCDICKNCGYSKCD